MKLTQTLVGVLFLGMFTLSATSCKKKGCMDNTATNYLEKAKKDDGSCTYKPTIKLNGAATVIIPVGATYTDAGAVATNKDGSAVTVTTTGLPINTTSTGSYTITYTATNDFGSVSTTRTVNVVLDQSSYLGNFSASSDCGTTVFPVAGSPSVTAGTSANEIIIAPAFTLVGGEITCVINGATITVPQQTVNITVGDIHLSGTGTMNATGTQMTITYTYDNTTPFIGGQGSCTATYVKQ